MGSRWAVSLTVILAAAFVLAACEAEPAHEIETGAELLSVAFDDPTDWETGTYPADAEEPESTLSILDGQFRIDHRSVRSPSFTWSLGGAEYENVVIDVETQQLSAEENNLYGVACRLAPDENGEASGYVLLISGDGYFGFARLTNRSLSFLIDWRQSDAIRKGRAENTIRAVCIGDYMALYVNGEFLGDVTEDTYVQPGQVGLIAGVTQGATISVQFDNLIVYEGRVSS